MGRSWRNFFRRSNEPEGEPGVAVATPEAEPEAVDELQPSPAEEALKETVESATAVSHEEEGNGAAPEEPVEGPVAVEPEVVALPVEPEKPAEVEEVRTEAAEE